MSAAAAPLVLFLFLIAAALPPVELWLRLLAGAELVFLWGYWLRRERVGYREEVARKNLLGLIPGHAVLFLGLGMVGDSLGARIWLSVPFLSVLLDVAAHRGGRSMAAALYAILWFVIFALIHRLVTVGKGLSGGGLAGFSVGMGLVALFVVGLGVLRIVKGKR